MKSTATSRGLYSDAARRIWKDKFAVICFFIVVLYAVVAMLASAGAIAADFDEELYDSYKAPSWTRMFELPDEVWDDEDFEENETFIGWFTDRLPRAVFWKQVWNRMFEKKTWDYPMGTDFLGRDVWQRIIHGSRIAMSVGLISSLIAVPIGVFFGALAGYFGGRIDEGIVWFYSTVASIPELLLILTACMVLGKGMGAVYVAIGMTTWVTLCRLIRAEFMKHKQRDYVIAAKALGAGDARCIFVHILPNVFHLVIINLSLRFVAAIKVEVILSYLGVGAQGQPSWGVMINDAKQELLRGVWWQLFGATAAMFFIVLALSIFADALRDALDPKLRT